MTKQMFLQSFQGNLDEAVQMLSFEPQKRSHLSLEQ